MRIEPGPLLNGSTAVDKLRLKVYMIFISRKHLTPSSADKDHVIKKLQRTGERLRCVT